MEKIAFITGASKGIGKELAEVFAKKGYSLIMIARNIGELEQIQSNLKNKYQCTSKILSIDLTKPESIDLIMDAFKDEMSNVDVLINNAGFGVSKKFTNVPLQDITSMIEVNITALTKLTYRVLPYMMAKKSGKILNVASTAAFSPGPYMSVYYATKAYVLSFSEAIREEYRKDGITISVLCPGMTKTHFSERAGLQETLLFSGFLPIMLAEKVANIAYKGLMKRRRIIIPGFMNKNMAFFMWFAPSWLTAKIIGILEKPKV